MKTIKTVHILSGNINIKYFMSKYKIARYIMCKISGALFSVYVSSCECKDNSREAFQRSVTDQRHSRFQQRIQHAYQNKRKIIPRL